MNELLDTAPGGFLTVDDAGTILAVNHTLLDLLGHARVDVVGQHVDRLLPVAGRIFYQTHVFPMLTLHGQVHEIYLALRTKAGGELPILLNATRRLRDGAMVNDIVLLPMSQRSLYEEELLRAKQAAEAAMRAEAVARAALDEERALLTVRVAERTAELQQAHDELERRVQERTRDLRRVNRALETRSACSQALVHAATEAELLASVCDAIVTMGGYRHAQVDERPGDQLQPLRAIARAEQPSSSADTASTPAGADVGPALALPLLADGALLGTLRIQAAEPAAFDAVEAQLLAELAADLAFGIAALRTRAAKLAAEAELQAHAARLQVIADVSRTFAEAGPDYATVVEHAVRTSARYLEATCLLQQLDAETQTLQTVAGYGPDPTVLTLLQTAAEDRGEGDMIPAPTLAVLRSGHPLLLPQVAAVAQRWPALQNAGVHSLIVVPLHMQGRADGSMVLARHQPGQPPFSDADVHLAQDLAERAALAITNAQLYAQAQAAVRTRDAIMASVSHDLRNPLSVITGYSTVLRRRMSRAAAVDSAAVLDVVDKIEGNAKRMNLMIGDLVDAARLGAGYEMKLNVTPIDLVPLLDQIVAHYQTTTRRHQLRFATRLPELYGMFDAERVERVLGNLLSNAIKFSPAGSAVDVTLTTVAGDGQQWASIAVRDRGVGIPAGDLPLIFDRFHRAANVGSITGTGLGLAGAQQIVEQHGGYITVASTPGQGSTFTIFLPLVAGLSVAEASAQARASIR